MYYSIRDSRIRYLIDLHRTGDFGEVAEGGDIFCDECRGRIRAGDNYYIVRNRIFCLGCEDDAEEEIVSVMRGDFLYQL